MSSAPPSPRSTLRTARRVGLVLGTGFLASVALTGVAQAHVEVVPESVPGGAESAVVAFRVPNESDQASTVTVKVLLPQGKAIASVQTSATPGWTATTQTRKLPQPIENDEGEQVTSVVSQVTWRATGAGIQPGQYQDFDLSLGPLPDSGKLVFNAVQTYSDGTVVTWNEVSADKSVEAEHPAPALTLSAPEDESDAGAASGDGAPDTASDTGDATAQPVSTVAVDDSGSDSGSTWALLMSGAALVVSLLTGLLVWRRGASAR
jgi:uncharacterized protein YcnI